MAKIETIWEKRKPFNQTGLEIWAAADGTDSASTLYDASGNGRDFSTASNPMALQQGVINNLPAIYNDGTKNALEWAGDGFTLKHFFIVASADEVTFGNFRGLLAVSDARPLLTGNSGAPKFVDYDLGDIALYHKAGVVHGAGNLQAPMTAFQVIEVILPLGIEASTLKLGRFSIYSFKGWVAELVCFSLRKGWCSRMAIYRYFAEKYHLWRETPEGKKIFPFPNNHASPFTPLRYKIQSPPLPNGKMKTRVKGAKLQQFEFNYTTRRQAEADAIDAFETDFFDGRTIAVENNSFYPPRLNNIVPVSDISVEPGELVNNFGYKWSGRQTDTVSVPVVIDADEPPDTTPPTVPGNVEFAPSGTGELTFSYDASTDDKSGVDYYEIEISLGS